MYVHVSGHDLALYNVFSEFGQNASFSTMLEQPDEVALVVFAGGADIDPSIYGHARHPYTSVSAAADARDEKAFEFARKYDIPMVGICRGSQFLVAKAGGFLYQHTTGHHGSHQVLTKEGDSFQVTSSHHQMFGLPLPPKAELLAWSEHRLSSTYEVGAHDGTVHDTPVIEPECVYLPNIKALAVQWHPEWMRQDSLGYVYVVDKVRQLLMPAERAAAV